MMRCLTALFSVVGVLALCLFASEVRAEPERRVIVVPGILGSQLSDASGDVVWGRGSSLFSRNFKQLNLLPDNAPAVNLVASDILREVPLIFGAFSVGLYSGLTDYLTGDHGLGLTLSGQQFAGTYTEGETLFVFPYDWRRSNFANAARLNDFIAEVIPEGERFDIVAHSMGGLLTRAFLSDRRPEDICTSAAVDGDLSDAMRDRLCGAAYGSFDPEAWPTAEISKPFEEAARLHTLIEIAVPHRGSVNVAGTLVDGWGRLTEVLVGGKREIQTILISMTAPYELAPSYDRCCARGVAYQDGNVPVAALDEDYWANEILGFGVDPCPYPECRLRREILRLGLQNRRILDAIVEDGLPDTVVDHHIVIGRFVTGTRETVYVAHDASGDGTGISYRSDEYGDGTVYEGAMLEDGKVSYAMRSKHAFIVGSTEVHRYIYNVLINPVRRQPEPVNNTVMRFANGRVEALNLALAPRIAGAGQEVAARLDLTAERSHRFDADELDAGVVLSITPFSATGDSAEVDAPVTSNRAGLSARFEAVFTAPTVPGVYRVAAKAADRVLMEEILYVSEE